MNTNLVPGQPDLWRRGRFPGWYSARSSKNPAAPHLLLPGWRSIWRSSLRSLLPDLILLHDEPRPEHVVRLAG